VKPNLSIGLGRKKGNPPATAPALSLSPLRGGVQITTEDMENDAMNTYMYTTPKKVL
jgi:hypothetical protein